MLKILVIVHSSCFQYVEILTFLVSDRSARVGIIQVEFDKRKVMRITKPTTLLLVASLFLASGQSSKAVAESAALNAEREKFLRTLQQVRKNFESADEDGDDVITRGQFRVFVDANAEIDFAMSKQIKRMRAYQEPSARSILTDGTLSWEEYLSAARSRGGRS